MLHADSADAPLRVAFTTLGCRLNQYETEGLKAALALEAGFCVVPWDAEADVYVLNSCTVTSQADRKCRQLARQIKRRRPASRVVVAGCYAQTQSERLLAMPEIDGIVGNAGKDGIAVWLPALLAGNGKLADVGKFPRRLSFRGTPIVRFGKRSRAFLKVQDGCDLRCSYCVIWRARGPARSLPVADAVSRAAALQAAGYHEIVLVGVNLGSYGRDLRPADDLGALVARLLADLPELRLRLSSLHPEQITVPLLELLATQTPRLRPHLHLSLQSGSDVVLARMRRPYRVAEVRRAAAAAVAAVPDLNLGADVIVGHPGETEAEFTRTAALLEELPLTYLHVFPFSARPGTAAAACCDRVMPERITERAQRLRSFSQRRRRLFAVAQRGQRREAIVEATASAPGWRQATTDHYLSLTVPDRLPPGALIRVTVGDWQGGRLQGEDAELVLPAGDVSPRRVEPDAVATRKCAS